MALKKNSFEGGSNGTTLTAGNTGGVSGDAFSTPTIGASASVTFSNAQKMHGTLSCLISNSINAAYLPWTGYSASQMVYRFYFRLGTLPSAAVRLLDIRTNTVSVARVSLNASNVLVFQTNNGNTTLKTFSTLSANTWYRVEVAASNGTAGSTLSMDYYLGDSATPVETGFFTNAGNSGTTGAITQVFLGNTAATSWTGDLYLDDPAANDGTLTYIGVAASPPSAAFSSTSAGLQVTVDGTATTAVAPATITSYDWDWGDSTTHGTGSTPAAHTYTASGTYTVTLTVTDSNGLQSLTTASVTAAPASGNVSVASISVGTNWTASSGTQLSCISDGDGTTYITSSAPPTAQEFTFILAATTPPSSGQPFRVFVTLDAPLAATASLQAQFYDGATLKSTLTGQAITPVGAGVTTVTNVLILSFPWTDVSSVSASGWNAPKVKLLITAA